MKAVARFQIMKIGLCGTMSVGKTTLVNALKELGTFEGYITRTERSKHLMSLGIPLNTDSTCLLYTSPSPRDRTRSRMPSSA